MQQLKNVVCILFKQFVIQLMHQYIFVDSQKLKKNILKVLRHVSDHRRSILRELLYSAWLKIIKIVLSCPFTWTESVLWQHNLNPVCVCTHTGYDVVYLSDWCRMFLQERWASLVLQWPEVQRPVSWRHIPEELTPQ